MKKRKHNQLKKYIIRVALPILGLICMVGAMYYFTTRTAEAESADKVTRGVIYNINELPQYGKTPDQLADMRDQKKLGTPECPFVVLEILPYEEYAEIGYMIGGCEPIDVSSNEAKQVMYSSMGYLCTGGQKGVEATIFCDEKIPDGEDYSGFNEQKINWGTVPGYLERVADGTGNYDLQFIYQGNQWWHYYDIQYNEKKNGNWKWVRTGNPGEGVTQSTYDENNPNQYNKIGSRFIVNRPLNDSYYATTYRGTRYTYKNNNTFLTETLGLTAKEAETYSIVVKSITPKELNKNPEWIDYANLFNISSKSHRGNYVEIWSKYPRKKLPAGYQSPPQSSDFYWQDITGSVALKLYERITADKNYAPAIISDDVYNFTKNSKEVPIKFYDYDLKYSGYKHSRTGVNNNVYKLCMMLFTIKSEFFHYYYLNDDSPYAKDDKNKNLPKPYVKVNDKGELIATLQEGDSQLYWSDMTFMLIDSAQAVKDAGFNDVYSYLNKNRDKNKVSLGYYLEPSGVKNFVGNHTFSFPGDNSITSTYLNPTGNGQYLGDEYEGYRDFLIENGFVKDNGDGTYSYIKDPSASNAVTYILDYKRKGYSPEIPHGPEDAIKVLDIEPSVGVDYVPAEDNTAGDSEFADGCNPDWRLTESRVRLMIWDFSSAIDISHMTTASFNGKTEDLTNYDFIYMGLDTGAYEVINKSLSIGGGWRSVNIPKWNDGSTYIYRHTGDKLQSAEYAELKNNRTRSAKYNGTDSTELRFPGNDITRIKQKELLDYAKAGYPIIAETHLYNAEKSLIDPKSNVYALIGDLKKEAAKKLILSDEGSLVKKAYEENPHEVLITSWPNIYDGTTDTEDSVNFVNANYLEKKNGRASLEFKFHAAKSGYRYEIYVDQDNNSKFTKTKGNNEVLRDGAASIGDNTVRYELAQNYTGLVSWQFVVYNTNNETERYVKTGCSVVRNTTGNKAEIKVLQICPDKRSEYIDNGNEYKSKNFTVDLATDPMFTKYYHTLDEYDITIVPMTATEYLSLFKKTDEGETFHYDVSSKITVADGAENPVNTDLVTAFDYEGTTYNLMDFHMIVIGFGDTFGGQDIPNKNGAVEFLEYYIASGKSVLFTHDLTSLYNMKVDDSKDAPKIYGYTANTMLRDVMGMNSYKMRSTELSKMGSAGDLMKEMEKFQKKNEDSYWTIDSTADQGYTYYALKKMGWYYTTPPNANYSGLLSNFTSRDNCNKIPYKAMVVSPLGDVVCDTTDLTTYTGFNNNNDFTNKARKTNTGQITEYPFKINEELAIGQTHGQWYQLNLEDKDVAVWYTLADDGKSAYEASGKETGGDGTAITYGVSPDDASNNYYIYSKGNVFYSGIGHSKVAGPMEAKLFINTMIAAYRASYEAPVIEVTSKEASLIGSRTYSIEITRNYDSAVPENDLLDSTPNRQDVETFKEGDAITIKFMPIEYNLKATKLYATAAFQVGNELVYMDKVTDVETGNEIVADEQDEFGNPVFTTLSNSHEYSFPYLKSYLDSYEKDKGVPCKTIVFTLKNDLVDVVSTTKLQMSVSPLFQLD